MDKKLVGLILFFLLCLKAAVAAPVEEKKQVFLFLDKIVFEEERREKDILSPILKKLALSRLNALEGVKLKTNGKRNFSKIFAGYGEIDKLDRVSLINIKNNTGYDGYIKARYSWKDGKVELSYYCVDLKKGTVFLERTLIKPIEANLFQTVEKDLANFAISVRRSYRVTLKVSSTPENAEVLINRQKVGQTPLVYETKAGKYNLEIKSEGFKAYKKEYWLKDGNELVLDVGLINPIAAHFLNAPPGLRLDANEFSVGQRYVHIDGKAPNIKDINMLDLSYMVRSGNLGFGLRYSMGTTKGERDMNSFVGEGAAIQDYDIAITQFQFIGKYIIWEKFSFLTAGVGGALGMSYIAVEDSGSENNKWTPSGDVYFQVASKLGRIKAASLDLRLDVGFSYLGEMSYTKREFSMFGRGRETEEKTTLLAPMVAIHLNLNFWNDIF